VATLRPHLRANLDAFASLAIAGGIVAAPGLVSDAYYCIEWWWRPVNGAPEALRVSLDPAMPDFFDYVNDDWFEVPISTGANHVAGPYVDYSCTNQYSITLSVPAFLGDHPLGVAAMDVPLDRLERRILSALFTEPADSALVNSHGRVIASSASWVACGDRLARPADQMARAVPGGLRRLSALTGWTIVPVPENATDAAGRCRAPASH
jgi:hypothetical protein